MNWMDHVPEGWDKPWFGLDSGSRVYVFYYNVSTQLWYALGWQSDAEGWPYVTHVVRAPKRDAEPRDWTTIEAQHVQPLVTWLMAQGPPPGRQGA